MRPTFHQLKLFEAVARHLSFTRAGEELHLTQPTVSMQIRALSDQFGVPLFDRVGRRITLTQAGRELYETTRELLDAWAKLEIRIADLQGLKRGRLGVAVTSTAKYFIPAVLGRFLRRYPEIDVRLEIHNRQVLIERMRENLDDLYVMNEPPAAPLIHRRPFLPNPLVVVAPVNHPLAGQAAIPLDRLAEERFIMREVGSGTRVVIEQFCQRYGVQPQIRMEFGSNEAIKHAVAAGLGISIVSAHTLAVAAVRDRLTVLNVDGFPLLDEWSIVHLAGKKLTPLAETFLEYLSGEMIELRRRLSLSNLILDVPEARGPVTPSRRTSLRKDTSIKIDE
jgi:DNA-binding transcriptional LysR family regulator